MFRLLTCVWIAVAVAVECRGDEPALGLGIVDHKPDKGLSVKVGQRYMVPYVDTIPGTAVEFEMVPVPGGTCLMGTPSSEAGRRPDEGPQIRVQVPPMWVGKFEVTRAEYREFEALYNIIVTIERKQDAEAKLNDADVVTAPTPLYDPSIPYEFGDTASEPTVAMTQFAAQQYTKWLSALTGRQYRLPSEAEWEYVCRAGAKTAFSWGDDPGKADRYAWYAKNADERGFRRVGGKHPNTFGIYDMHGNVGEWTVNAYTEDGYRWLADRKQPLAAIETVRWPKVANSCVVRGGHWEQDALRLRCASRMESDDEAWKDYDPHLPQSPWWYTSHDALSIGFRLFRSYQPLDRPTIAKFWDHTAEDLKRDLEFSFRGGRGRVVLLDDDLSPAIAKYHQQQEAKRRRVQDKIRRARPDPE